MSVVDEKRSIGRPVEATDAELVPPRFWWLKRICVAVVAIVFVFAILFTWAEYRSRALLNSRIREWKAAGQSVDAQDFNRKTRLPDERNAAKLYYDAAAAFAWPADIGAKLGLNDLMDLDKHLDEARKVVAANQPMLDLIHRASELEEADWGVIAKSPLISMAMPSFSGIRQCAKCCGLAAQLAVREGNSVEAIRILRDSLRMADLLNENSVFLIQTFTALALVDLSTSIVETVTNDLARPREWDERSGELRRESQLLIKDLLNEGNLQEAWKRIMFFERTYNVDAGKALANGSLNPAGVIGGPPPRLAAPLYYVWRIAARPIWRRNTVRAADRITGIAGTNLSGPYCVARSWLAQFPQVNTHDDVISAALSPNWAILGPGYDRVVQVFYRNSARRRMAACALAIRLYEWDYGRRPARLEQLVPDYLPRVPIDPFDPEAGQFRYLPDATPARLYSVGVNEVDEGGEYELFSRGGIKWREKDLVFRLDPEPEQEE